MTLCYSQGSFKPIHESFIPVSDMSVQRGIGVFEAVRTYGKKPFALAEHLERLTKSANIAGINAGGLIDEVKSAIKEGIKIIAPSCKEGHEILMKPYITGGDVKENNFFPNPRLFILFEFIDENEVKARKKTGVKLALADGIRRPYPDLKSIDYLLGYISSQGDKGAFESLYTYEGFISESTSSSFFMCIDGKIVTAPLGEVLGGVTRGIVIDIAKKAGFKLEEKSPAVCELGRADEAFITGTVKEILSIVQVGGIKIGNGSPGPVCEHLNRLFKSQIETYLE